MHMHVGVGRAHHGVPEIASKMQKSCGSKTLVHALALVGLGGTVKTQLVLRYIEQHRKRYDTIL